MADQIEEIKTRIDIVELIREYTPLSQAGANFRARCLFHEEKSPSFMVSQQKQIWHCFGSCNEGGDIFKFIMKKEGIEFGEALRILAQRAGVKLEYQDSSQGSRKNRALDALEYASRFYREMLKNNPRAQAARTYLEGRRLDEVFQEEFIIGFALPDGDALVKFLISKKFHIQEIIDAGLALKSDKGYGFYDRFRNRIMIPIRDIYGRIVGFGGRTLEDAPHVAKYINSPQSLVYDKGRTVFGLDRAKHTIRQQGFCVLVEGYMDFFRVYQSGMQGVVATSGTALTDDQIHLLKRFTDTFYFAFDADAAGTGATVRAIEMALREGIYVKVICLPRGGDGKPLYKDPDECIVKDPAAWQEAVKKAESFLDFHFRRVCTDPKIQTDPFMKKNAIHAFFSILSLVPDRIVQDHWIKILGHHFNISESVLWEDLERGGKQEKKTPVAQAAPQASEIGRREQALIALLVRHPALVPTVQGRIEESMFSHEEHRKVFQMLSRDSSERSGDIAELVDRFALFADHQYGDLEQKDIERTIDLLIRDIRQKAVHSRMEELKRLIYQAEKMGDQATVDRYAQEFSNLVF